MMEKIKKKTKFFLFKKLKKTKNYKISNHKGWNGLKIFKIEFLKNSSKTFVFDRSIFKGNKLEKILVLTDGNMLIQKKNFKKKLKKFDCIHTYKALEDFKIEFKKNTKLFLILGNKKIKKSKVKTFNFGTNLKKIDLWGGQCISRVFNGDGMTVVLFKLKKGFEFHDKGHHNEQITWLIKGKMRFYVKNSFFNLVKDKKSVDIGPFHPHGGTSLGAIGFDAFLPKRSEKRYS